MNIDIDGTPRPTPAQYNVNRYKTHVDVLFGVIPMARRDEATGNIKWFDPPEGVVWHDLGEVRAYITGVLSKIPRTFPMNRQARRREQKLRRSR